MNKLKNNSHINKKLQNSWNKHGENAFVCNVIEYTSLENLLLVEQSYLDKLTPYKKNVGYNIAKIAGGGDVCKNTEHEEYVRQRQRDANIGENHLFKRNKFAYEKFKKVMSSKEHKEKMSKINSITNSKPGVKQKIRESNIKTKKSKEFKDKIKDVYKECNSRPDVKLKQKIAKLGLKNPSADHNNYTFVHKTGFLITGTKTCLKNKTKELSTMLKFISPMYTHNITDLFRRSYKSKGWRVL